MFFSILFCNVFTSFFLHTQVGSRLVLQTTGILMIILGVFGKFGAVFITIPDPVIGGMFLVMFGMIAAVGISNLQVNIFEYLSAPCYQIFVLDSNEATSRD